METKQKKHIGKLLMILFPLFILLLLLVLVAISNKSTAPTTSVEATPTINPTPTVTIPLTRWGNDSNFLETEKTINNLERDLGNVDLKDLNLTLPTFDLNVKF